MELSAARLALVYVRWVVRSDYQSAWHVAGKMDRIRIPHGARSFFTAPSVMIHARHFFLCGRSLTRWLGCAGWLCYFFHSLSAAHAAIDFRTYYDTSLRWYSSLWARGRRFFCIHAVEQEKMALAPTGVRAFALRTQSVFCWLDTAPSAHRQFRPKSALCRQVENVKPAQNANFLLICQLLF